jgi:Tfp pilus assembly protein PilF
LALAPGSAWVQGNTGWFACWLGRFDFAVAAMRRAVTLDPENVRLRAEMIMVLIYSRRYSEAQMAVQEAQTLYRGENDANPYRLRAL